MKTDIEIAQEAKALNIVEIAKAEGIDEKYIEHDFEIRGIQYFTDQ